MTEFDFLHPVPLELTTRLQDRVVHVIGNNIKIYDTLSGIPNLEGVDIAFVTIEREEEDSNFPESIEHDIRWSFYNLFPGNWLVNVADLGIMSLGDTLSSTIDQVTLLAEDLIRKEIVPVILGGVQDLTYGLYRAYDNIKNGVNIVAVDSKFDFSTEGELVSMETYMGKIINSAPFNLFGFVNLGYQTYYNAQEEIDLLDDILFEAYRFGYIDLDMRVVESVFRNADVVSIDLINSIKAGDIGLINQGIPTGFSAKDMCRISRYAGIGDHVSSFGVFETPQNFLSSALVAQMFWYFVEGYNYRNKEVINMESPLYERYTVTLDGHDINFYKSRKTERWWIEFPEYTMNHKPAIFPCSYNDYKQASANMLPKLWLNIHKRLAVFNANS